MAKTLAIITTNGNSIAAQAYAYGQAYNAFKALVTEHNGTVTQIETPFGKRLQGNFDDEKIAKKVATALNKRYASVKWAPVLDCDRTIKPTPADGDAPTENPKWQKALDKLAGKGKSANKQAAEIIRAHGMKALIGEEGWTYWEGIRG